MCHLARVRQKESQDLVLIPGFFLLYFRSIDCYLDQQMLMT